VSGKSTGGEFNPALWVWGAAAPAPRILHSMVRVRDVDAALRFYLDGLGMKLLGRFDVASRRSTGVFIGYGDYSTGGVLELVDKWDDTGPYTHGSGYGHVAIGVPDILATIARLAAMGAEVITPPTALMAGGPRVAFVRDPDGYELELIQTQRD
jgi:lactoylglutathione lyase